MRKFIVCYGLGLLFVLSGCTGGDSSAVTTPTAIVSGTATPPAPTISGTVSKNETPLKPGGRIGEMVVTVGWKAEDPVLWGLCAPNSTCTLPARPRLVLGDNWRAVDQAHVDANWPALRWELYLDGHPVDLAAFGTVDIDAPSPASDKTPGLGRARQWNVVLEHATPGAHEIREVVHFLQEINDGASTYSPRTDDVDQTVHLVVEP